MNKFLLITIAAVLIVGCGCSGPNVVESYKATLVSNSGSKIAIDLKLMSDKSFAYNTKSLNPKKVQATVNFTGNWKKNRKQLTLDAKSSGSSLILKINLKTMKLESWVTDGEETIERHSTKPIIFKST